MMKTCNKCGESKPLEAYYKSKANKDGLCYLCKECEKAKKTAYYAANKEKSKAKSIAWYEANRERAKVTHAKWYLENKLVNIEKRRATSKAWASKNRQRQRSLAAAWYEANKSRKSLTSAAWRRNNPEKRQTGQHRRRSRKANNGVNLVTVAETAAITAMPCTACAAPGPSEVDHIVPIARGGSHSIGNLMPLCRSCNASKKDLLYIEWKYSARPQALKAFAA